MTGLRLLPLLFVACSASSGLEPEAPVPDFSLQDTNPNSSRFGEAVSPRDYLGTISAWYFGHGT